MLAEGKIKHDDVIHTSVLAIVEEDTEAYELSCLLLSLTSTQRKKLFHSGTSDQVPQDDSLTDPSTPETIEDDLDEP